MICCDIRTLLDPLLKKKHFYIMALAIDKRFGCASSEDVKQIVIYYEYISL